MIHHGIIPPHALEIEQGVLRGLLIAPETFEAIEDLLQASDFYTVEHQTLFKLLQEMRLHQRPIDVLTVVDYARSVNLLEAIGQEHYIFELAMGPGHIHGIRDYAKVVKEKSLRRGLLAAIRRIESFLDKAPEASMEELIDRAEQEIFSVAGQEKGRELPEGDMGILLENVYKKIYAQIQSPQSTGLFSGFADLDNFTLGFQPADFIILAGRPSMGKTAFAMNIVEHVAFHQQQPVLVFSLEMPAEALMLRMLASRTKVSQQGLRTGDITPEGVVKIQEQIAELQHYPLRIDDTPGLTPSEMRSRIRRFIRKYGKIALIVVDYLQLMRLPLQKENRTVEISEISRSLKMLAKEFQVPVLALSQLNRSVEQRTDKRPQMADLRDSGSIEQDADLITFLYRDEVYHPETSEKNIAELILSKHRNGPIGALKLYFNKTLTKFENLLMK